MLNLNTIFFILNHFSGVEEDLTPEDNLPIGKNILNLTNIQSSANYTCVAASTLGVIEATTMVKVQCEFFCILYCGIS